MMQALASRTACIRYNAAIIHRRRWRESTDVGRQDAGAQLWRCCGSLNDLETLGRNIGPELGEECGKVLVLRRPLQHLHDLAAFDLCQGRRVGEGICVLPARVTV
jgi:hypothetical protein